MDIQLLEFATVVKNGQAGDFQSLALGLSGDIDPDAFTYSLLYTNAGMNLAHYSNPKLDGLLDSGRATVDQAQRAAVYRQIQQIGLDEQPVITYWNAPQIAVARASVQNYPATYNGFAGTRDLDKVWKSSKTS
jgi:peptide/nickel transport system substrate-binding protein